MKNLSIRGVVLKLAMMVFALQPVCWAQDALTGQRPSLASACNALESIDLAELQDAPTQITEAKLIDASAESPSYCQVSGYVTPNVGFLLRLPLDQWNGKLIELGCGGFCGSTRYVEGCHDPLRRGYACIVSDGGHRSTILDDLWAYNNLPGEIDHGVRADHVTALVGKAIVARYYRQAPKRAYFMGCSTGGRQAMLEAQRFPWDFDGIVAGAPSLSEAGSHLTHIWGLRALTDENRKPLFSHRDLEMVHAAALAQCDMDDGIKDGIIGDPGSCKFDPRTLICRSGGKAQCLTETQADALVRVYAGPTTSTGERIYPGRAFPGAELNLISSDLTPSEIAGTYNYVANEFRYSAFDWSPGPKWQPEDFNFDRDYKRLGESEGLLAAHDPDLRRFKAAGGKLISYVGLNDIDQAEVDIDYYDTVEKTMGGRLATQEFFRLFVLPGMNHCTTGDGAFDADYLTYLEAWVEKGHAPDKVISYHVKLEDLLDRAMHGDQDALHKLIRRLEFPLAPGAIEFSRPVYPYPTKTRYSGHGDPKDAASFGPM
jgi:hypothetical protein